RPSISVGSIATMLRSVLPFVALATATVDVSVRVPVEIVFVVDVDVAVVPIAIAPVAAGPGTERKSRRAPRQPHPRVIPWISIGVIGICRRSINDFRVIGGHVNYIGLSWLDY